MGNSGSAANSEVGDDDQVKDPVEDIDKENADSDGSILDLMVLFDPKQLRIVADKIKEDVVANPVQQHHSTLTRWLEERRARGAETVSLAQFIEAITNKGISKDDAKEIFQQFDATDDGVIDLDYLHEMLDLSNRSISGFSGVRSDLQAVNKLLQDCVIAPGFIDAFTTGKTIQNNHGQKIFKFLSQNRALSTSMPLPSLQGFITSTDMRLKVLNTHLSALKERADSKKREPPLQADEILKPINRCFTSVEVSSNRNDASKLIDNESGTYWQSDGAARSHWVRLTIPSNVVIKQLSMYVVSSDQSYMPHHVVVYGGRNESNLRELNDVHIPNHITGDFTLIENLKVPFAVIQISIKRCHSDGCDTRIRQIKAVGYRVVKSKGVSVMDSTAMWYLSVLASTAQATLPFAPHLRETIIEHTRLSLSHMGPLSLSSSSTERPGFLSNNVMEQMENFLHSIICMEGVQPHADELIVLLEFALTRGGLGSILDVLTLVLEQINTNFKSVPLINNLLETEEKATRKHGQKLPVVILSCDGGSKDAMTNSSNVLSENWKTDTYLTATGKTKCNMAFGLKTGNLIQLTRVFMKLSKGAIGPKSGLIFVFDSDNIKDESGETLFQPLTEYDDWTENDFRQLKARTPHKGDLKPTDPVAFFSVDKDWADVDVCVDYLKTGSCVAIKFLGPRQPSAERLGIIGITLYGYEQNEDSVSLQKHLEFCPRGLQDDKDAIVSGTTLFLQTLQFLQVMCRDAAQLKGSSSKDSSVQEKDTTVDVSDVSMEQIWNMHGLISASEMPAEQCGIALELLLSLFHIALPCLRPTSQKQRESRKMLLKGKRLNQVKVEKEGNDFSSEVFKSLCNMVDQVTTPKGMHSLAKAIILDGAEVFFPDAQSRRAHLLSLVDKVMEDGKAVSLSYTFESLCRFFSNKDASGLLGLPDSILQESFQPESVVHVMKTLVSVAHRECTSQIKEEINCDMPSNLVLLLCAMQKSLLAWCQFQCLNTEVKDVAVHILVQYIDMICDKSNEALGLLENSEEKVKLIDLLECSFISIAIRQLVLFLNLFSTIDTDCIPLLRHLQPLAFKLGKISAALPDKFSQGHTYSPSLNQENTILREWEVESEHEYENNMNITKVFNCPGCTSFRVEFDPKCQTERRYDYLEFTDSCGRKRKFDRNVGTDSWPAVVNFEGQRLHFLFHSDGSNTEWGYKFKVFALGSPDVAVSWIFDLQLNIARCFGIFCGNALNFKKALGMNLTKFEENEDERALLHSELWGSLFRGGYMVGKLERSLSGFHGCNPSDSSVNSFLCSMAASEEGPSKEFLARCQVLHVGHKMGGELFDVAVKAVFASLLWHTQELRDQIPNFFDESASSKDIPLSIINAYNAAESIRRPLLESRQKLLVQKEDGTSENANKPCDPDSPVTSCREKALFLLKFAGLSKFMSRKQSCHNLERRVSTLNRASRMTRQDSYNEKRSSHNYDEQTEKYPSFQLILDFILNDSLSHKKIHELLQHRRKYAKAVENVYTYASEYITYMTENELLQIPCILFLQSMLVSQDQFPPHYGDYLNGCGLELENRVRRAFYAFIRKLCELLSTNMSSQKSCVTSPMYLCTQAYLLHFLDVEWKTYDYHFVSELNLPYLLIHSVKGAYLTHNEDDEEAELKMYERHKKFFNEAKNQSIDAWCNKNREGAPVDIQRDINLFIARYSADLDVVITCDGCQEQIQGRRHRCLNCIDMDLCSKCYNSSAKPDNHTEQHQVIDLRYNCDGCRAFIIETHIHCNECHDFDLCLGCYRSNTFPACHNASHTVTRSRLIPRGSFPLKPSRGTAFQTYIHYHSWMQFCALALSLSETIQNRKSKDGEQEYIKEAGQLLLDCMEKLVSCLLQPLTDQLASDIDTTKVVNSKVKFEDIEQVIRVSERDTSFEENKETVLDFPVVDETLAPPKTQESEPTLAKDDSYFDLNSEGAQKDEDKNNITSLPDLEEDNANEVAKTESDITNLVKDTIASGAEDTKNLDDKLLNEATKSNEEQSGNDILDSASANPDPTKTESSNDDAEKVEETVDVTTAPPATGVLLPISSLIWADSVTLAPGYVEHPEAVITKPADDNKDDMEEDDETKEKEKTAEAAKEEKISSLQEKILSLIGAIIPVNKYSTVFPSSVDFNSFVSQRLLPVLFTIIRDKEAPQKLRMITLGVLSKVLHCFGPKIADEAILLLTEHKEANEDAHLGSVSAKFLFDLGAECLRNADLDTASGVESVLKCFWGDETWRKSVAEHATKMLQFAKASQDPSLSSLFSLMFLAGFPDIFRVGLTTVVKEIGHETKNVVVLNSAVDDTKISVVNFKNRKMFTVKESFIEPNVSCHNLYDGDRLSLLLDIVRNNMCANKETNISLERLWVLGLACKALLNILKAGVDQEGMEKIVKSGVLPSVANLGCQGTGFSKHWLLRDLEILSWKLYKAEGTPHDVGEEVKDAPSENKDVSIAQQKPADVVPKSPLDGLDEETKLCMETIHDALKCPYPILRAIYEHNGQDREKLLEEVQRSFDGTAGCIIRASNEIRELAKKWEKKEDNTESEAFPAVDSSIDVGILKFQPQKIEFKELQAKPEGGDNPNKLISSLTEEEINETMSRQKRMKSSELLKKEMELTQRENPRQFAEKVSYAVAVGYSRHLVGWLFARWRESDDIMSAMLKDMEPQNIVGLLDLIQSVESKEHFQKVVFNFIRSCNIPLALSAVQCMSEVRLATETKESDHKYKNNAKIEDKVHILGATSLFIRFDDRCSTEYSCDELVLSSSPNYLQNRRVFSGATDWQDFEMPGDTVFYRFTSDSSNNDWGWKFTVTGGQLGRFETGCSILSALLAQDLQFARRLPLKQLWSWLIVVACNQVGQQRLMATGLLLRILQISSGDPLLSGDDAEPSPEKNRPNLSLLRPLWTLYTNSVDSDTGTSLALISPVIRGLSELFLVVENVAQDWGEADDLVAGLAADIKLKKCFSKVVRSIAAIGVAINLPNKALEMLQNAKEMPPPPPSAKKVTAPKQNKRHMSTIQLRITGDEGSDDDSDDDMLLDDDTTQDEDDDDDGDSDSSSDLSHPEGPP